MHNKSEVFSCFKMFHNMTSTQFNAKVQILRSDDAPEYMDGGYVGTWDSTLDYLCKNGVAKGKNK